MCVYSQEAAVTRDALAGEPLKVKQFKHAVGFCPVGETAIAACIRPGSMIEFDQPIRYKQTRIMGFFSHTAETRHTTAKLISVNELDPRLKSIPEKDDAEYHHDWLELPDGALVCLNRLVAGQIARVRDPVKKILDDAKAFARALLPSNDDTSGIKASIETIAPQAISGQVLGSREHAHT